jgi:CRP/FNR family transcriptional regulator, dissimilatory nitrate respiration regulator
MNPYLKLIENTTLLSTLPSDYIKLHLANGNFKVKTYTKNSIIHFEGDHCFKLEIVLTGKVVVARIDESGNLLTIAEFFQNDILGGNLMFSKNPYFPMTSTALEESVILEIEKNLLFTLLSESPVFLKAYLEFVADHTFILGDKIKHYVNKTIRECVLGFLDYESKHQNSNKVILNMTKQTLADKIGVQRTSLSRELSKMRNEGLIEYDSKSITIL